MKLFEEAKKYIPGGVNSPVRSFQAVGGVPVFIKKGQGAKIFGENGNIYLDYCLSWGALILGHAHPAVVKEVGKALKRGTSFGTPTKLETELAKKISQAIPSIERLRLVNSGTEAVMTAVRLARAYNQRKRVIRFTGSYHGHADFLLSCPGVLADFSRHTITVPYNDIKAVEQAIRKYAGDMAAIIVEPVAANMGVVLPKNNFLKELRAIAHRNNIVLIFDEVITGFRLCYGGAQDLFRVKPDLTCLGKVISGGLPFGAVGGKKEIMNQLAPEGPVYQGGTFSGNPVSVSAGIATLRILESLKPYRGLELLTRELCLGISKIADFYGYPLQINYQGSMFSLFFTVKPVDDYQSAGRQDINLFKKFYQELLEQGVYFSPSGYEANFLSIAHTRSDITKTLKAVEKTFSKIGQC